MLFMIVERFNGGNPVPVYRRFAERGRLLPDGVEFVEAWIADDLTHCYQVMRCDDRASLDAWTAQWDDIVSFEIIPVMTSPEAMALMQPRL